MRWGRGVYSQLESTRNILSSGYKKQNIFSYRLSSPIYVFCFRQLIKLQYIMGDAYHDIHLEKTVGCYASSCSHDAPCVPVLNFIIMRKFQRNSCATKRIDNKQKSFSLFEFFAKALFRIYNFKSCN